LYINKYIIVLFSGSAEYSGTYNDPAAKNVCMNKRKKECERVCERERKKERKRGSFQFVKGSQYELFC